MQIDKRFLQADEAGVRLEIVGGVPVWEFHPVWKHQEAIDRIRASIEELPQSSDEEPCACIHISDVYISFPDGSLKRPDIAIFCEEPSEEEKSEAISLIPEAVVEVISKGYEAKDLELSPYFYLAQGVEDVVVFDPHTSLVLHFRKDRVSRYVSPVTIEFQCGCRCMV